MGGAIIDLIDAIEFAKNTDAASELLEEAKAFIQKEPRRFQLWLRFGTALHS